MKLVAILIAFKKRIDYEKFVRNKRAKKTAHAITLHTLLQNPLSLNERVPCAAACQHTPFNGGFEW
ncbi:MAG: hypothetical protein AB8G77_21040 [Rhodothermales bacterium]